MGTVINKAITFSYDDGVTQDIRLVELFDKYGMKCTFNLNSEMFGIEGSMEWRGRKINNSRLKKSEIANLYKGHEVAAHTLEHINLTTIDEKDIVNQVETDRLNLSDIVGYEVIGMAYPCIGVNNDDRVADVIKNKTSIKYSRTIESSYSFDKQTNLYRFNPTVKHQEGKWETVINIAKKFLETKTDEKQILYIWGHSYEFDLRDDWDEMENLLKSIAFRDDVFYGTNSEVLLSFCK